MEKIDYQGIAALVDACARLRGEIRVSGITSFDTEKKIDRMLELIAADMEKKLQEAAE